MKVFVYYDVDGYVHGWGDGVSEGPCFQMEYDENSHFFKNFLYYKVLGTDVVFDEEYKQKRIEKKAFRLKKPEYEQEVKEISLLIDRHRDEKELEEETTLTEEEYKDLLKKRNELVTLLKKGSEL